VSVSLGVEQLRALRVQLRSMARETYRRTLRDFGPCRDSSNSGLRDELLARSLAQGGPGCNHDGRVLVRKDRYEDDERKREGGCGCGGLRLFSSPGIAAASQYFLAKAWDGGACSTRA
jgi:hypothetical protein